ncbi:hypothetical protein L484_010538 [Morus notabilis]|uniref:Uncharacterized protein n=1 Tax=Morus notabilis TaxID=981085 RepID=W9QVA0_9ROSA|nr:hypothetical protein L484_010538 [Morus notabilis]
MAQTRSEIGMARRRPKIGVAQRRSLEISFGVHGDISGHLLCTRLRCLVLRARDADNGLPFPCGHTLVRHWTLPFTPFAVVLRHQSPTDNNR